MPWHFDLEFFFSCGDQIPGFVRETRMVDLEEKPTDSPLTMLRGRQISGDFQSQAP